jgi:hypothetical protein
MRNVVAFFSRVELKNVLALQLVISINFFIRIKRCAGNDEKKEIKNDA